MKNIILMGLFLMVMACEKNDISPSEDILGKWEMIQIGNWPEMYEVDYDFYFEFLPNNSVRQYSDSLGLMYTYQYYIDDTLNIAGTKFTYNFHGDKMRLEYAHMRGLYNTQIYKRIN